MYYLQSRYYDPAIGRFINSDVFATTDADGFLSCNMFAYCENDPVNKNDNTGEFAIPIEVARVLIGGLLYVGISSYSALSLGMDFSWKDAGAAFLAGALAYSDLGKIAAVFSGVSTYLSMKKSGVSGRDALMLGVVSAGLTYASVGNLATIVDKTILYSMKGVLTVAAADGMFGLGTALMNSALQKNVINNKSASSQSNNKYYGGSIRIAMTQ